jgi:pimeloyl-ACP methyl ester carboxylesterase
VSIIHTSDADFYVDVQGAQPRVVLVHGLGDDLHTWDGIWPVIGTYFSAMRYDLRGFGQSSLLGEAAYSHADDLLAILNAMGIEQCDLVGVSMGGSIALNFTLDHPERVRNLVLISPGMVAWEWSDAWLNLWQPIVAHARHGEMDAARRLWWEHPLFSTTRSSAAGPALHAAIMRYSGQQWIHDHHKLMLPDVDRLHQLATRTLLLSGGKDLQDFRLIADLIEASASNLRRIDHPALGHLVHLEDPQACAREIVMFLGES